MCISRSSQAPNLDVDKLFEEIMLDMPSSNDSRSSAVLSPQKKEDAHLRYSTQLNVYGIIVS